MWVVLGVEVECGHAGGGDVGHAVGGCAADVEHDGDGEIFDELVVEVHEEASVVFTADEVAGGVVGEGEDVGSGFDLGESELDGELFQSVEHVHDHRRVVDGGEEEGFDSEDVVGEGPGAHGLADDCDFVAEFLFEDADRLDDGPVVGVL